jgi:hypothetical protein
MRVRWLWLPVAAFSLELACAKLNIRGTILGIFSPWLVGGLAAGAFALRNAALPGLPVIVLGLTLNTLAMAANGGYMPTTPELLAEAGRAGQISANGQGQPMPGSKDVPLPKEETRFWPLTDVFVTPPGPYRYVYSLGDIFLAIGGGYFAYRGVRPRPQGNSGGRTPEGASPTSEVINTN